MQVMTSLTQELGSRGRGIVGHMDVQHIMDAIVQTQNRDILLMLLSKIDKEEAKRIVVTTEGQEGIIYF